MPKYYKRSNKDYKGDSAPAYKENYTVLGNPKNDGSVPLGTVTAKITKEENYPNFDVNEHSDEEPSSYGTLARNLGISRGYLFHQLGNSDSSTSADLHNAVMNTAYTPRLRNRGTKSAREDGISYAKSIKELKNNKELQPTELFTTIPPSVEITEATVDPSLKSSFLTIGAMLHKQHGMPITASDDLSRWSSGVSKNAQRRGLPILGNPANPNMDKTNDIDLHKHYPFSIARENVEELVKGDLIPDSEVQDARQHLRTLLGHSPKPAKQHLSHQFNDVPLPGMETF